MTKIYLVRHGITPANKENRFAGRTQEKLHPDGLEQIRRVGEQLLAKDIARIFCGPLLRTVQSAEILKDILKVSLEIREQFNEIDIPHWDGLTKDEIRQLYGKEYPTWLDRPQSFELPGCETIEQVQQRAVSGIECLLNEHHGQNILVVSHLIVLRSLVLYYRGMDIRDFRAVRIDNGAILCLTKSTPGRMEIVELASGL
jgi:broad specificity phosphatase PhoE